MIGTNLATRPFYNQRAVRAVLAIVGGLVVLATLYNIENALVGAMKDLYRVLTGTAIDLQQFERALGRFGDAMKLFDEFDQTSNRGTVGTNTMFVVFDRLVRMASHGPSAAVAILRVQSQAGDQSFEQDFLSDEAAAMA